jgi:hypothetical protein
MSDKSKAIKEERYTAFRAYRENNSKENRKLYKKRAPFRGGLKPCEKARFQI